MGYELAPWVPSILKSLVAPLAAAFAGAYTAQAIAKRNANLQRWQEELRATNSAVAATQSIVATAASLKQQHVRQMWDDYEKQAAARVAMQAGGQGNFVFQADLKVLPPMRTALPMLEKLLYERVSASRAALGLFAVVFLALEGFSHSLESRSAIITSLKARSPLPPQELAEIYFGLVTAAGHSDETFPATLEAMAKQLDCVILYGCALAHELYAHADDLANRHKKLASPRRPDFSAMAKAGLLPEIRDTDRQAFEELGVVPDFP
jgi:hypothetical protein